MTRFVNGNILRERGATGVLGEASFQRNQAPQRSLEAASASVLVTATQNACLLYTSPSPRDQRGTRMPSSA